jgi:Pin2-interacting protein X1
MTALGWNDSKGLGQSGDGNPNHIAVVHKLDNGGIGMNRARKEGEDNAAGAGQAGRGLEDVLKRLAAASASPSPAPESPAEASASDKELKKRNKIACVTRGRSRICSSRQVATTASRVETARVFVARSAG